MIVIAPIPLSIAHYNWKTDQIHLWNWKKNVLRWYRHKGESLFSQVVRTIAHEEMHRILYHLDGFTSAWNYDFVTKLDLGDLP